MNKPIVAYLQWTQQVYKVNEINSDELKPSSSTELNPAPMGEPNPTLLHSL